MNQSVPMIQLGGRLPAPPPSRRVRPSIPYPVIRHGVSGISTGMAAPPPSGDWASRSRHQYGWPVPYQPPARPETVSRRWPWQYGKPFGLGTTTGQDILGGASAGAAGAVTAITSGNPLLGAGTSLLSVAPFTGLAAPFVAVAGAVTDLLGAIGIGQGCGQTCIDATTFANRSAALMQQNMAAYFAIPAPRPISIQQQALANFDALWQGLISPQACGNPALGPAGQRCISERAPGGVYDDAKFNRDPIASDPAVPDCQSSIAAQLPQCGAPSGTIAPGSIVGTAGVTSSIFDSKTLLVVGLLAAAGLALSGKGGGN